MEEDLFYSLEDVCSILELTESGVYWRCKELNIKRFKLKNERGSFVNKKQLNLLLNYKKNPCPPSIKSNNPIKIKIVECFLKNKKNSIEQISKELNITKHKVHSCINEYLQNKTITVMSKL